VLAELAQGDGACDEVPRRLRKHNLPSVSSSGDAGRAVHVDPDVAFVGDERFAGVDSDSHAQGAIGKGALPLVRGFDGVGRALEGVKECISLRVDFGAAAFDELGAEDPTMFRECAGIRVTELVEERRRTFDVREEERDCARR
jgi:hypothetical protein